VAIFPEVIARVCNQRAVRRKSNLPTLLVSRSYRTTIALGSLF
jgi:hypothetical protein